MSFLGLYFTKYPLARALRVGKVATLAHARFGYGEVECYKLVDPAGAGEPYEELYAMVRPAST